MSHIVYEIEKHPDRLHGDFFGPFDTYAEASAFAKAMHDHDNNKIITHWGGDHGSRRYDYIVNELTAPENA